MMAYLYDLVKTPFVLALIKIVILLALAFTVIAYITLVERRLLGFFQSRLGPNRVGPWGLIQPIADGVKLFIKEDTVPIHSNSLLFRIAPIFTFFPSLVGFGVLTFALPWVTPSSKMHLFALADVDLGILLILSLSSLGIFGLMLGGYASGSKYPYFGGLRACSQMLSYEIPLTLSMITVVMMANSFRLSDIVTAQQKYRLYFFIPLIISFVVYLICMIAETNRTPFDLPEGESEIIGFHTEYSGMRFGFYYVGEYTNVVFLSMLAPALFLGGYDIPFVNDIALWQVHPQLISILGFCSYAIKSVLFAYFYIWVRATFPRYRYDQLLKVGWLVLLPISLVNLFIVAGIKLFLLK
jgi:NADH-quinone oxidoreductase subunit H